MLDNPSIKADPGIHDGLG